MSRHNPDEICEACKRAGASRHDAQVESLYGDLLRAARVVLDARIGDEDQIIPTLVCAANRGKVPALNAACESLPTGGDEAGFSDVTRHWFYAAFDGLAKLWGAVDGVPILREVPYAITGVRDARGHIGEICIDAFKRSASPEAMARSYGHYLELHGIPVAPDRGSVAHKLHDVPGGPFLRIVVRPETRSVDPVDARIMPVRAGPPPYPEKRYVAEVIRDLMGTRTSGRFRGYRDKLAGRGRGPVRTNTERLVLAVVAWYFGGRGAVATSHEMKPDVARILNRHLLPSCARPPLSEEGWDSSETLWEKYFLEDVGSAIRRLELALGRRAETRVEPTPD